MCYKIEKQKHLSITLEEKFKNIPDFISDFFYRYKSAATKNCNWGYIRDLLQWLIDKKYIQKESISDITTEDMSKITSKYIGEYLEDLQYGLTRRRNTLDSIATKRNVFSVFWNYMLNKKYVDNNIIKDDSIKQKFKVESTDKGVEIPSDEQIERFLCRLNDGNNNEFNIVRNFAIVNLIMGSGIRCEELINLDVKDLHLNGGKKQNKRYTDKPFIDILGKGKIENYSSVLISPTAKMSLEEYLVQRDIFVKEYNIKDNALFLSNEKKRISKSSITSFFNRYSEGTIFPHALRHLVGTRIYEQTKDIVLVQQQLRHSSLETAAKYYVHVNEDAIADAVANL